MEQWLLAYSKLATRRDTLTSAIRDFTARGEPVPAEVYARHRDEIEERSTDIMRTFMLIQSDLMGARVDASGLWTLVKQLGTKGLVSS